MSLILDIDLDYFPLFKDPIGRFDKILSWAARPVDLIVDLHHKALTQWSEVIEKGIIESPIFILHVDEHHDMLSETPPIQYGNFIYFAMLQWPDCQVHWLTKDPIDHPDMWISEKAWKLVAERFTFGRCIKPSWPKPDLVTISTSPGYIDEKLSKTLLNRIVC